MSRLSVEAVSVARGGRIVLDGIDVTVSPGEILGLLGPNGAGKTSLLRVLAGLDRPRHGVVKIDGENLDAIPQRQRARIVGFLPQPSKAAWPITVEDLVGLGRLPFAKPFGGTWAHDRKIIEDALVESELVQLRNRPVTMLSAGEMSRVFLARALAGQPRLLLADEPTANLDPAHQLSTMTLLRRFASKGMSIVMAQHDLLLASRFCDRLLLIAQGGVVAVGSPTEILTPQNLAAVFGIVAHYAADMQNGFFAVPWSLADKPSDGDIVMP